MDEEGKPKEKYSVLEGTDWYSYCSNNPVRFVDLLGLDDEKPGEESSVNQLGTEPRQTVPDEVIAKYIDKGWAFIGDSMEKQNEVKKELQEKVQGEYASSWDVTEKLQDTTYKIKNPAKEKPLTELFWDYSTNGQKRPDPQPSIETKKLRGIKYKAYTRDPKTGETSAMPYKQYIDVNGDSYIDFIF